MNIIIRKKEEEVRGDRVSTRRQRCASSVLCRATGIAIFAIAGCAYDPAEETKDITGMHIKQMSVMEVSDEIAIVQNMAHIDKLILHKGASIKTHGQDVTLRIGELISEDAIINTTPNPEVSLAGEAGTSGGYLKIYAAKAQGKLHIISSGQDGAKGKTGAKGLSGNKGGQGHNAETKRECVFPWSLAPNDTGRPEPEPRCSWENLCHRAPGNGGQGHGGHQGHPGTPGLDGGDSAMVLVDVADPSNFKVTYEVRVGTGGLGGLGGEGGDGGPGGDPGHGNNVCGHASAGPIGPKGPQGASGKRGSEGSEKPLCLRLGNLEVGDCNEFEDLTRGGAP